MTERPVLFGEFMTRRNFLSTPLALCACATALPVLSQVPMLEGGVLRVGVLTH